MKENYKEFIDQIHAPTELIENTIKKVNEEKKLEKSKKKRLYMYLAAGAVAAMVTVTAGLSFSKNSVVYTPISQTMVRINDKVDKCNSMSIEDYEKYIGIDLSSLINDDDIEGSSVNVIWREDGITLEYDEAVLNFSDDGNLFTMKLSKTNDLCPEELINSPESKIGKYKIHFGTDESKKRLYAGGNINGVNYFIIGNGIEKNNFQKKIEKYFNSMKPFE